MRRLPGNDVCADCSGKGTQLVKLNAGCKTKTMATTLAITANADKQINQSEVEVNSCSYGQPRENVCEQVVIGSLVLIPICLKLSAENGCFVRVVRMCVFFL